jgi:hypothetical protein
VFSVKYELGFYITEDDILRSHRRENFKSYNLPSVDLQTQAVVIYFTEEEIILSYKTRHDLPLTKPSPLHVYS